MLFPQLPGRLWSHAILLTMALLEFVPVKWGEEQNVLLAAHEEILFLCACQAQVLALWASNSGLCGRC